MTILDNQYWNKRYYNKEIGWDIGYANPAIMNFFKTVDTHFKILIPGCGNGYEGEQLFKSSFKNITLLDYAELSKTNFCQRVPEFNSDHFLVGDFFEHEGQYDFIIEQTFFCALNPALREKYVTKMKSLLKPSGKLIGVMFDFDFGKDTPPFGGSKSAYLELFSSHFSIANFTPCILSIPQRLGKELWIEISEAKN